MKTSLILWSLSFLLIIIMFVFFASFYTFWTVSFIIIFLHIEIVGSVVKSQEVRLLSEFEKYLSHVRHNYYISHMVEESLEYAIENNSKEMTIHAVKIHNIITSENPNEGFRFYNDTGPNKYIRLFLALSIKVMEYGDQIINDQSLYLSNISQVKNDIHIELLKLKNTRFAFSGLSFITVTPILFLHPIRNWAVSNLPELALFYDYSLGKILAILIYLITFIAYIMLNQLKETPLIILYKHSLLSWISNLPIIKTLLKNYINKYYTKTLYLQDLLKEAGERIQAKEFILKGFSYGFFSFLLSLLYFIYLNYGEGKNILYWYQFIFSFLLAYFFYLYPYLMILYKRKIMKMSLEDEIVQFQSIIMMVKNMDRISILNILEFMEDFAVLFKDSIHTCINDFDAGDIEALNKMKETEKFEPFRRIVNGLIISDKIGICNAFDEISTDQVYYQDKRKLDNEMLLAKKGVIGKIIANIPLILTIGLYLITPFVVESLNQLKEFTYEWNLFS